MRAISLPIHRLSLGGGGDLLESIPWTALVPEGLPYHKGKKILPETSSSGYIRRSSLPIKPTSWRAIPTRGSLRDSLGGSYILSSEPLGI